MLKKILTHILLLALSPALVLGGTELGLRLFYADKLRTYFDEQTELVLKHPVPRKSPNEYRIFIFGGSAAYGFPVADRYSIAAWLRKEFPYLLPQKKIQVMNCAWPGKASHHVLEGAHVVLKYQPDLFVIYSGHNDTVVDNRLFLDNWLYWLNLRLTFRSALYRFLQKRITKLRKHFVYGRSGYAEKHYREEVIAKKVYKKIEVSDQEYQHILTRYRQNMTAVIQLAKRHGVDVLFVNLPSNLRDILPSASVHALNLDASVLKEWEAFFERGKKLESEGRFEEALGFYKQAAAIDSTYAELQYRMGTCFERVREYDSAKKAFTLARDYDALPWRAKSSLNQTVRDLSAKNDLILVDIVHTLEQVSPHGIIGAEMIYDNVHPSIKAEQLIADDIAKALQQRNKIAPADQWQWHALEAARENQDSDVWKVDGSLNAYRYVLKGLHSWEHGRFEDAVVNLEKGLELMPAFIESYAFLGDAYWHLGKLEKASQAFQTLGGKDSTLLNVLVRKYPDIKQSYAQIAQTHVA